MRQQRPSEHQEQCAVIDYVRARYPSFAPYLFAVPNGARTAWTTAKRLKDEGLSKGYPDLGLDYPMGGYHGLRIEMKRRRGSRGARPRTSPEQDA